MVMREQGSSVRCIAQALRRSPSTISHELSRYAAWSASIDEPRPRCGYDACHAGVRARQLRFKPRRCRKLATDTVLFDGVRYFPSEHWSPAQIAGTLRRMWPDDSQRTVSHETMDNCIYALPRGELRRELIACLRRAQRRRMPRSRGHDRRGQLPEALSIHLRPPEANERAFPGQWEGDLIKGAGNRSAVGVLLQPRSRLVMLAKLNDATAAAALEGFSAKLRSSRP